MSITISHTLGQILLFIESAIFFLGAGMAVWEWQKPKGAFYRLGYHLRRVGFWGALGVAALLLGIFVQ